MGVDVRSTDVEKHQFWCCNCARPSSKDVKILDDVIPVYRVNIGIYSQDCKVCGKMVVENEAIKTCLF
jgi:hypothetical protein